MKLQHLLPLVSLAAAVPTAPLYRRNTTENIDFAAITPSANLTWQPCGPRFHCAVLQVPLDYSKPMGNRALVPLLKYPSKASTSKGMILVNPGGPGESAVEFLINGADLAQNITGGNFDIVAWEPRGLGQSTPVADCSSNPAPSKYHQFMARGNQSSPTGDQYEEIYEMAKKMGMECKSAIGGNTDAGQHMTTSIVAKDIISILDAYAASPASKGVEYPNLLNYWGFSYGTIIGQTFASMFPERMGRVILDGVVDPYDYSGGKMKTWLQHADDVFATFFLYCHLAGPKACPYHTGNTTSDIFSRFETTLARLDINKALEQKWENATGIVDVFAGLQLVSFMTTYTPPTSFDTLARALVFLETAVKNLTADALSDLQKLVSKPNENGLAVVTAQTSISCSDNGNIYYNKPLKDVMPVINQLRAQSWLGGDILGTKVVACAGWGIDGVERYSGPFGGKTKNPILFISNTRDPVTPIENGRNSTKLFKDSQLLTIDGSGNRNFLSSDIAAYFQSGKLPGDESFCALEAGPWKVSVPGGLESRGDWKELQQKMKDLRLHSALDHE
ncbi:Alpha/Beta hydrolase protein [Bisporella sp. PMI_857]|nr:Alpha/Beta hydrolase protein [Bisporella sp. PMI_857]